MTLAIFATRSTEADIADAFDWYEAQEAGLGEQFLTELELVKARIATNPLRFPIAYRDARRARLNRFPYVLLFRV